MMRLVFTAFNRIDYFRQSLESWAKVRGFQDWAPTVYLEPSSRADRMTRIADEFGVRVVLNPERYGVLHNPWVALEDAFSSGSDFTILAEEDIVVGTDTLEYFEWIAEKFAANEKVFSATAYSHCGPSEEVGRKRRVELLNRFTGLVWGTWPDRWYSDMRDTWDHDYSSGQSGGPSGWDWNIQLRVLKDRMCVHPMWGRSDHIGEYGEHVSPGNFAETRAVSFLPDGPPCEYIWD